jgi:hypothetical protein
MSLVPEGQTGEAWETYKKHALWDIGGTLDTKILSLSFV